ncbi:MAG: UvrD-helicase domain-containing protein [Caldilineaceae bacterium]|nr:UvrD-helicase domain-containing protein [Caldilineaceae bacterium]
MNTSSGKATGQTVAKSPDFDRRSGMRGLRPGERIVAKSSGVYRLAKGGPTQISVLPEKVEIAEHGNTVTEIHVDTIDEITVRNEWSRSQLIIRFGDGQVRWIGGLEKTDADRVRDAVHVEILRLTSALGKRLLQLDGQLSQLLGDSRYTRRSEADVFHIELKSVLNKSRRLVQEHLARREREALSRLAPYESVEKLEAARERENGLFVKANIPAVKSAGLPDPMSDEQAEAIATDEDVTLVLAGAGTGKTRVIAGKVAHLVQNEAVQPQEILVLAFNNKAAENIRERLKGDFDTTEVKTFHAFGRSVIASAEGRAPAISKLAEDEMARTKAIDGIIRDILQDPQKSRALIDFIANLLSPYRPPYDFSTPAEYKEYISHVELRTLNGDLVKSLEELAIANFLTENGIKYEYERPYKVPTATQERSQYRPDFFLPDHNIYIEHFALNKSGQPPRNWYRYREGVDWKRDQHRKHRTNLIQTFSWQHERGELLKTLRAELEKVGVKFDPIPHEELVKKLARQKSRITKLAYLLKTFLNHFKTNSLTLNELRNRVLGDWRRNQRFLDVFEQVHERYERLLADEKALDFHDLINSAACHIREGRWEHSYRYVLVDEFQDISAGRMALLQSLRRRNVAYFLVGDDWQSINRFAGSDVALLQDCGNYLGHVERRPLSQTFRFGDRIGGPSTAFVRRNPEQTQRTLLPKPVNSVRDDGICVVTDGDPLRALHDIKSKAGGKAPSVLVLGRYRDSTEGLPWEWRRLFRTVHQAKGLEEDYVVVLDLKDDRRGFPSQIEDDPVLELVLPSVSEGACLFAEERRLFYVAMTRARRGAYLVTDPERPSAFVLELLRESGDLQTIGEFPPTGPSCPRCPNGHLVPSKSRKNLRCTNDPYCRHLAPRCPGCGVGYAVVKDRLTSMCTNPACSFRPMVCPKCHVGVLEQKRSKFGPFLGCSEFQAVPPCFYKRNGSIANRVGGGIPGQ